MCELCKRPTETTRHHLIPRSRKKREAGFGPVANLCPDCHRKCHATWDNATLAREYNTVDKLLVAPELQSYLKWIKKQAPTVYFGSRERLDD